MAENILSGSDKTTHVPFGLLPGVALHNPTALDSADIINAKADQAIAVIQATRALLRADPSYPVDGLLDSAEYALAAILDVAKAIPKQ
jgi:hypothetical protein